MTDEQVEEQNNHLKKCQSKMAMVTKWLENQKKFLNPSDKWVDDKNEKQRIELGLEMGDWKMTF